MLENFRLRKRTVASITFLSLIVVVIFFRTSLDKIVITIFFGFAYFTGLIAMGVGVFYSILAYLTALPIISTLHAYIAFILVKIHYIVFRVFMNKTLRRIPWFNSLEIKVTNSSIVRRSVKAVNNFLKDLGLKSPRRVKFLEVTRCKSCSKDVPADGAICPYCREEIEIGEESSGAIFHSQFKDFYSQIEDLVGLKELRDLSEYPGHKHFGENIGRLRHSYTVAWFSYKIALRLDLDRRLVARAGLLHDIGYSVDDYGVINQIIFHAQRSSERIKELNEEDRVAQMVSRHMFPLGWPPVSMESWALWTADKIASLLEFFRVEHLFKCDEVWRRIKEQLTKS